MGNYQRVRDRNEQIVFSLKETMWELKSGELTPSAVSHMIACERFLRSHAATAIRPWAFDYSPAAEVATALTAVKNAREPVDLAWPVERVLQLLNVALGHTVEAQDLYSARNRAGVLRTRKFVQFNRRANNAVAARHRACDLALQIATALQGRMRSMAPLKETA